MADDCDMYASLAFFSNLPHVGEHEFCESGPCALSKILGAFSLRKLLIITVKYRVYSLCHVLLESQCWIRFERPRFAFCDAKVLFAEKL